MLNTEENSSMEDMGNANWMLFFIGVVHIEASQNFGNRLQRLQWERLCLTLNVLYAERRGQAHYIYLLFLGLALRNCLPSRCFIYTTSLHCPGCAWSVENSCCCFAMGWGTQHQHCLTAKNCCLCSSPPSPFLCFESSIKAIVIKIPNPTKY